MSTQQPKTVVDELGALLPSVNNDRVKPDTYLASDGTPRPMVKSNFLPWSGIQPAAIHDILTNPAEYVQAAKKAIAKANSPGEAERLAKLKAAKDAKKKADKKQAPAASNSLADELAQLANS